MDEKIDILLQQRGGRWPRHRMQHPPAREVTPPPSEAAKAEGPESPGAE